MKTYIIEGKDFVKSLKRFRRLSYELFSTVVPDDAVFIVALMTSAFIDMCELSINGELYIKNVNEYWLRELAKALDKFGEELYTGTVDSLGESVKNVDNLILALEADVAVGSKSVL